VALEPSLAHIEERASHL